MAELPQSRHLATEIPGPKAQELAKRRASSVAAGVSSLMGTYAVRSQDGIVEDVDGNRLIDLGSGIAVTSVGASAPAVVDAVQTQVAELTHTCFMATPYEGYIAVAEKLAELAPIRGELRTALFNSGAEAVENAVKIARTHTGRQAVAALDHAYHGRTTLTMALTAKSMPYKHGFGPFAPEVYRIPGSYPYRDQLDGAAAAERSITTLEKSIGAGNLAALILEPIQGEGGFIVPAEGYIKRIADWCKENGVVFIADEIQTGFARTGAWFACEHEGVEPDIITTAKGIAGGMPLSGVTGRAEIMDSVHSGGLGGTYAGSPVSCAAALAAISTMESQDLSDRARQIEQQVVAQLKTAQEKNPRIGEIRGRGAMLAIELVDPATGAPDAQLTNTAAEAARSAGVITLTCGTYGNVIRFLPPLTISDELLSEGIGVVVDAIAEV
ncbi:4-aminobutyrate--2-oxoglutarate transaminase [Nesterenkonia sp. MY13]|uniref:(S)-3-amino-2-methylpropionate transaminase n=1 Tax=Nesterenkonia sedimenti TaxID=1463632 RepID=A0A7X8TJ14_9MICC|nr:4-aminobutyrate--2-oxoglutarate transaminase [Nesterenkonia sedimenti]NLS09584.1 4-aminobutyrate--2-oxoglutarate transaminase [Nesterenkonia sedimenti]